MIKEEQPIRALIVDDEELAIIHIKYLLKKFPRFGEVEAASNLQEALVKYEEFKPDVIFLDINIREHTGFEFLERLEEPPPVIFSTAHEEHALEAFNVQAFDYILKPIDSFRFNKTVQRFIEFFDQERPKTEVEAQNPFNRIFLKEGDKAWFVTFNDIIRVESESSFSRIIHGNKETVVHRSLIQIASKLPSDKFFRANRQTLVNLEWVADIQVWFQGKFLLVMKDGTEIQLSRSAAKTLRDLTAL